MIIRVYLVDNTSLFYDPRSHIRFLFARSLPWMHAPRPDQEREVTILGLTVQAETNSVAVCESKGEMRSLGTIADREDSIRKFIKKLGSGRSSGG